MFYFYNTEQANWIMIYNWDLIITSLQPFPNTRIRGNFTN